MMNIQIPSFRQSYQQAFNRKIAENFGYVSSIEEAYKLIAEFESLPKKTETRRRKQEEDYWPTRGATYTPNNSD